MVGDVIADALAHYLTLANDKSRILKFLGMDLSNYFVLTVHRPSTTDNKKSFGDIMQAAGELDKQVVFPVHPRTRRHLKAYGIWGSMPKNVELIDPVGYLDMIKLMANAEKILTDSGGVQKEAFILNIPCITLRETTEWVETVQSGWNTLVGVDKDRIVSAAREFSPSTLHKDLFGLGACRKILKYIESRPI